MFHKFGYPIGTTFFLQRKKNVPTNKFLVFKKVKIKLQNLKIKTENGKWHDHSINARVLQLFFYANSTKHTVLS